jgi:polar amino acid transport system substrate-binding protein
MPKATKVDNWDQLKGQPVCGIQGSYYNKKMTEEFGINLVNFKNQPDAYRALKDNRCIGFVFDDMTLQKKLEDVDWADYKIAVTPYEYLPMAGGLREDNAAFAEAVNNAIVKAEGEGKLIEWETKYGMPHSDYIANRAKAAAAKLN